MKNKTNIFKVCVILSLSSMCSGCILTNKFLDGEGNLPKLGGGIVLALSVAAGGALIVPPAGLIIGAAVGLVLDETNPGKVTALNALPLSHSVSEQYGVTEADLEKYNDSLNTEVITLEEYFSKALSILKSSANAETMNAVAIENGFKDAEQLKNEFMKNSLSKKTINQLSFYRNVSPEVLRIYLQARFNVKVEK